MNKIVAVAGWILAVVGIVATAALGAAFYYAQQDMAQLQKQFDDQSVAMAGDHKSLAVAMKENDELKQRVTELEKSVAEAKAGDAPDAAAEPPKSAADLLGGLMSGLKGGGGNAAAQNNKAEGGGNPMMDAMANMMQGEGGAQIAEYSANVASDMAYRDLLKSLNLAKDKEDVVKGMFKDYMSEQIKESMGAMKDGADKRNMGQIEADAKARLKERLATVLSPQELAQWEEYESTIDEHMMAQQFDMQLNMLAPGLSPESREAVMGVLVEESLAASEAAKAGGNVQQALDGQVGAFDRARERIAQSGQLDEAQMAEFDKFITAYKQQMELAKVFMGGNQQQQNQPKK